MSNKSNVLVVFFHYIINLTPFLKDNCTFSGLSWCICKKKNQFKKKAILFLSALFKKTLHVVFSGKSNKIQLRIQILNSVWVTHAEGETRMKDTVRK